MLPIFVFSLNLPPSADITTIQAKIVVLREDVYAILEMRSSDSESAPIELAEDTMSLLSHHLRHLVVPRCTAPAALLRMVMRPMQKS